VSGEPLPAPPVPGQGGDGAMGLEELLVVGMIVTIVIGGILRAIFGRLLGATWPRGSWVLAPGRSPARWLIGVVGGLLAFVFVLVMGAGGGTRHPAGGMGGGGFGRGGGGGGWSGGVAALAAVAPREVGEMRFTRLFGTCSRRPGGSIGPSRPRSWRPSSWRSRIPRRAIGARSASPSRAGWISRRFCRASMRARAVDVFAHLRVWDTEENTGVLIYVQWLDRRVEIVADRGIARQVPQADWDAVCRRLEMAFREGRYGPGAVEAVRAVGELLAGPFPARGDNPDELPNRPVRL
jgi:uncharacterized membrane protein YgcG